MCHPQKLVPCFMDHTAGSYAALVFLVRQSRLLLLPNHCLGKRHFVTLLFYHLRTHWDSLFGIVFRWHKLDTESILNFGARDFVSNVMQ